MTDLTITHHAFDRYRQRLARIPQDEIEQHLNQPIFQIAADFGAPYVRLPSGHRVVIKNHAVITILPPDFQPGRMGRKHRHWHLEEAAQ